jgi:hypothetical protein
MTKTSIRVLYNKSSNFTNPSLPQIEMIDIGHKSLPIIIGPYSKCASAEMS